MVVVGSKYTGRQELCTPQWLAICDWPHQNARPGQQAQAEAQATKVAIEGTHIRPYPIFRFVFEPIPLLIRFGIDPYLFHLVLSGTVARYRFELV